MTITNRALILKKAQAAYNKSPNKASKWHLMAVSKSRTAQQILDLLSQGQILFGENRVQEAEQKWPAIKQAYPQVQLHLIGPLQRNKIKKALALFTAIHSLDRISLANALVAARNDGLTIPPLYIQVNVGEEEQKAGVMPCQLHDLYAHCFAQQLPVVGLMAIPPLHQPSAPYFGFLLQQAKTLRLPYLSMGMSADYEEALSFGATHIRVGTALWDS